MSHLSLEELELIDEPKYRNYINSVDKALKNFEYTSEWADLIAALGKLNKVLQSHSKFNIIPRRVIIAKRLAQCLHPALPSGVHLKALETYDLIFKLVGAARLSNELFIYSAGLYPLLAHAAINVRPVLLTLYEVHLVPIAEYLKPGLSGFLNGVLPGLEEGADHYDRTSTLFDKISNGVSSRFFFGCLWKCIAENPQIRLPAYTYILSHFDRKQSIEDQLDILGQNVDLMIHSMCASLEDTSVLVQRSALEFLLAAFPLHGSHLLKPDVVHLLAAAITALLRRDMSLNRRLFSWLIGNEPQLLSADDSLVKAVNGDSLNEPSDINTYFQRHSKDLLIEALQWVLKNSLLVKPPDMRPYRVLISLLEKPEIGPIILDDILIDVFRSLYFSSHDQNKKRGKAAQHDELVKTANLLFGTLEESYIWSYTGRLLQKSSGIEVASKEVQPVGQGPPHFLEMCKLSAFLLEVLSVDSSSDTQVEHLPSLLVQTADLLHALFGEMSAGSISAGIELCLTLLKKILPAHEGSEEYAAGSWNTPSEGEEAIESSSGEFHSPPSSPALISSSQHQKQLLEHAVVAIQQLLAKLLNPGIFPSNRQSLIDHASRTLLVKRTNGTPTLEEMLEECTNPKSDCKFLETLPASNNETLEFNPSQDLELADGDQLAQLLPVFKQCCNLLKELSAFPTYCAASMASHQVISNNQEWNTLPDWLQLLCLATCCLSDSSSASDQIYLSGASTLLDLTALTSSMIPVTYWKPDQTTKLQKGDTPSDMFTVVLLSVVTPTQLLTILNQSRVFQLLAQRLWDGVGPSSEFQQTCAELLHQLHTLAPPVLSHVAEDVVLMSLSQQMLGEHNCTPAVEKFTILWHLGRDLEPSRWGSRRLKTFDSCLQLLLDWLSLEPSSPQRTVAEGWFIQALLRNDLSRILDPLLLKLLKPHSARVSIRHVTFQPTNSDNEEQQQTADREDDIYAISSVNGQVIYHVTPCRTKSRPFNPSRSVLTLGLGADGRAPESFVDRQVVFPWQLPQQQIMEQTVGLFVNPFSEDLFHIPGAISCNPVVGSSPVQESLKEPESSVVVKSLLDELIETVVNKAVAAAAAARFKRKESSAVTTEKPSDIHPLHNHILLYCQVSDAQQTLHVLQTLRSQLQLHPRLLLLSLASTGMASSRSPHSVLLQELLARHRKCLFGNGFQGEVSGDWMAPHRSSMYLEILLQLLLYHLRTYYSSMGMSSLTRQEIMANRQVQLTCVQLLNMFLSELIPLVKDLGKGFSSFISDMLLRCRVQKVALHSTLAMLHVVTLDRKKQTKKKNGLQGLLPTLTEVIILFNEEEEKSGSSYSEATLISLVKLLLSIMALEDQLAKQNSSGDLPNGSSSTSSTSTPVPGTYQRGVPIHSQPLFTSAILTALKQKSARWLHTEFTRLLVSSLPLLGRSLPNLLNAVVPQVCLNLESLASSNQYHNCPPDYLITELEALTALCHFVLVDSPHSVGAPTLAGSAGMLGGMSWGVSSAYVNGSLPNPNGQILHNLMHAFTPNGIGAILSNESSANGDPYTTARRQMLSNLPRILVCIGYLWQASSSDTSVGKVQRQKLLEFVSPIGHHHGISLLAAVSVAWVEKRKDFINGNGKVRKIIPECGAEQLALVDLISSVRVLPPDTLVQLLRHVLKQPLQMQLQNRSSRLEVGLLHFFHSYLQKINRVQLGECWGSLLQLLREITTMAPPILFAGLVVFGEAVQRYQTPGEKRDQRELQEVTGKLLEACGAVAAACLEQTTWLRRNLSVRRETLSVAPVVECDEAAILDELSSSSSETSSVQASSMEDSAMVVSVNPSSNNKTSRYSIQALAVLAELLAPLQDLIFPSQDKERVIPLLTSLLANVVPYLRHHSQSNIAGLRAASQLLSSLSDYPATRRAWRKDVFDLLLDPAFFTIDVETLRHWKNIIDNLMCHDKDAFREFLNRVSVSPSGLFSSRELEMEMRTMLLKRLAFTLFCTDGDQYQRLLPDIQEKLSESLRLGQSWPSVQAQVFLCFRVLLLRTSQQHVTSLWPSVIAETVQVLSQLEHELRRDSEEFSSQIRRLSALDSTWVTSTTNGLQGHAHPAWLHLYLATCKLLHLALILPATRLPQFQMYRWAFVGDENAVCDGDISSSSRSIQQQVTPNFVPYLTRIYRLLRNKAEASKISLPASISLDDMIMPSACAVKSLMDLLPFFHAIEQRCPRVRPNEELIVSSMEALLERDFLEPIPV